MSWRNVLAIALVPFKVIFLFPFLIPLGYLLFLESLDRNIGRMHWYLTKKSMRNKILFGPYRRALKRILVESCIPWGINKAGDTVIGYRHLEEKDFQRRRQNIRRLLRDDMLLHVRKRIEK